MRVNFGRIRWRDIDAIGAKIREDRLSKDMRDVKNLYLILASAFSGAVQAEKDRARALGKEIDPDTLVTLSFDICIEPYSVQTYESHGGNVIW